MNGNASGDQLAVIEFLAKPGSYSHKPASVERIDTHGAVVFLAGERAYKLKRAVKLAYLDFSTLEKRRAICEREYALNSVTAPELYLGISPVIRDKRGALSLGGKGEIADWVVEMRRFETECLFDRLASAGKLDASIIERLGLAVERFHANAPRIRDARWPASLSEVVATVAAALGREVLAELGLEVTISALRDKLRHHWELLDARRIAGYVRRCHGDLHLKNIVLVHDEPRLFDALEFDEDLAVIDVLYDLAFLLMDLRYRRLNVEAHAVFNHYFTRDLSYLESAGLALLPFFMSLRAGVRAMVGLDGLRISSDCDREILLSETKAYAQLAKTLIEPKSARLVAIGGVSGTGKTTVSRAIAPMIGAAPGAIHLRSDVERKRLFGAEPTERLDIKGYTFEISNFVYEQMRQKASAILRAGHSVVLDATFLNPSERKALADMARECRTTLEAIWLQADEDQMFERIGARRGDASDADAGVLRRQIKENSGAPTDWIAVDATGNPADTARRAALALSLDAA